MLFKGCYSNTGQFGISQCRLHWLVCSTVVKFTVVLCVGLMQRRCEECEVASKPVFLNLVDDTALVLEMSRAGYLTSL